MFAFLGGLTGLGLCNQAQERDQAEREAAAQLVVTQLNAAAPALPAPSGADPRLELVRFLQSVHAASEAADRACFRAKRCGYVSPNRERGDVASTSAIRACLKEREPECVDAVRLLRRVEAPAAAAGDWEAWVATRYRSGEDELRALVAIAFDHDLPTRLRANGETFEGVLDWASALDMKAAAPYAKQDSMAESGARRAAENALLARLPGVCREGHHCTVGKVMHGAPDLEQPFWRPR